MGSKLVSTALAGLAALAIGCAPFSQGRVNYDHVKKGETIEGFPVEITYSNDECWRYIKITSPDGRYVDARDEITDCDKKFNVIGHEGSIGIGHPIMKYTSFEALEKLYQEIKSLNSTTK